MPGAYEATIIPPGATAPTQKAYKYAVAGMALNPGDFVYAIPISGTYVLLGGAVEGGGGTADATDIIVVNIASYSGSQVRVPASGTNAAITASHVLLASTVGTPANQTGDWTVTTYNGYLTLSGPASAATTVQLVLGKAGTTI